MIEQAEGRLIEWARYKFYPGWEEPSPSAVLGRLMDEGRDNRRRSFKGRMRLLRMLVKRLGARPGPIPCKETRGVRMELVVYKGKSYMCPPDGGAGKMVERMAAAIDKSHRCRQVGEMLDLMPRDLFLIVHHTYANCPNPREIPRAAEEAWTAIGISKATYFRRKRQMLEWLAERLGLVVPQAA